MARKVKKLPKGVVLIHYSKNGRVVSDLNIDEWYNQLERVISNTRFIKKTLIVKVGTENMVHMTRNLVVCKILKPNDIRYKYGKRIFRIDERGLFVGTPGKQIPPNFLSTSDKIKDPFVRSAVHRQFSEELVDVEYDDEVFVDADMEAVETPDWAVTEKAMLNKSGIKPGTMTYLKSSKSVKDIMVDLVSAKCKDDVDKTMPSKPGNPYTTGTMAWESYNNTYSKYDLKLPKAVPISIPHSTENTLGPGGFSAPGNPYTVGGDLWADYNLKYKEEHSHPAYSPIFSPYIKGAEQDAAYKTAYGSVTNIVNVDGHKYVKALTDPKIGSYATGGYGNHVASDSGSSISVNSWKEINKILFDKYGKKVTEE